MSAPVVEVQNLVKWYGPRLAVRDVSFSVAEGEVVGLLGPNGSGKSTIFRILTGYLVPTSGSVAVAGKDATTQSLGEVGYVPEDAPLYDHMRVNELLQFMAQLKGLFGRSSTHAVGTVAERLAAQGSGARADREAVKGLSTARCHRTGATQRSEAAHFRRATGRSRIGFINHSSAKLRANRNSSFSLFEAEVVEWVLILPKP